MPCLTLFSAVYALNYWLEVPVEVDLQPGVSKCIVLGVPAKMGTDLIARVRSALKNSGMSFPRGKITVSIRLPEKYQAGHWFDLAVACALHALALKKEIKSKKILIGELNLTGEIIPSTVEYNLENEIISYPTVKDLKQTWEHLLSSPRQTISKPTTTVLDEASLRALRLTQITQSILLVIHPLNLEMHKITEVIRSNEELPPFPASLQIVKGVGIFCEPITSPTFFKGLHTLHSQWQKAPFPLLILIPSCLCGRKYTKEECICLASQRLKYKRILEQLSAYVVMASVLKEEAESVLAEKELAYPTDNLQYADSVQKLIQKIVRKYQLTLNEEHVFKEWVEKQVYLQGEVVVKEDTVLNLLQFLLKRHLKTCTSA